ncbi:hypothetical protein AWH62_09560 [Maricaulis sp. W15]|uniref:hypothetical protein n=1 Tax=Maricaulis sp. W15 TaxID=1772333 RepID=UPI000949166D|nr:hypothetical protein [Maricaulis sp. W15]OLF73175.1 hypothetical protein AWH62_09560 [Maricaulis sp. W15]
MKSVSVLLAAASVLFSAPALGQSGMAPVHPVLDATLSRSAVPTDKSEWRFTITMTNEDGVMVGRFDGTRPEAERWQLVSPALDDLSEMQSGMWTGLQEPDEDEDDSGLFFSADGSDIVPGSLTLADEAGDRLVFNFDPQLDEDDQAMADHVQGALTVSRDQLAVTQLRVWAPESFKPHFAVRLNRFEMVQQFDQLDGLPAPVLTRMSQEISGRAAFQTFEQSFELTFTDIEYLGTVTVD